MSTTSLQSIVAEAPIIAIIHRTKVDPVPCIEHLYQNGIRFIEITMDTPGAVEVLEAQRSRVPANALLGAGTVTSVAAAEAALARRSVYRHAKSQSRRYSDSAESGGPCDAGCSQSDRNLDRRERGRGLCEGLSRQRLRTTLFPRASRSLRGNCPDGFGGVNLENAAEFIKCGVDALGLSGGLIPKTEKEFDQYSQLAHQLLEVVVKVRTS